MLPNGNNTDHRKQSKLCVTRSGHREITNSAWPLEQAGYTATTSTLNIIIITNANSRKRRPKEDMLHQDHFDSTFRGSNTVRHAKIMV